ncbi:MAG: DUF1275 domain-containing protein [Actinobacteria bacterium]|nr:DUF1275 domain-containing protein [Actinomycetota bacterium]MCB9411687.1 DUF1275 domain-containing protein [Actinomycetota bacterium]
MRAAVDEVRFFNHPVLVTFLLSWSVGVVDTYGYEKYGVFTTNQAGNLVVLASEPWEDWSRSGLAVLSLLGAVGGVALGLLLRGRFPGPLGLRVAVPIGGGAAVLTAVAVLSLLSLENPWVSVPMVSLGMTCVAVGVFETPAMRGWLTANTGSFLHGVAYSTRWLDAHWRPATTQLAKAGALMTLGFVSGAFCHSMGLLNKPHPLLYGLIPMVVTVVLAIRGDQKQRRAEALAQNA